MVCAAAAPTSSMMSNHNAVFLHGWGSGPVVWEELMSLLGHAERCTAPDLRGYGNSRDAAGIRELADAVAGQTPKRCAVVGWSLGALVALQWAVMRPQQISRLVLISATPCFTNNENWIHGMDAGVFDRFAEAVRADVGTAMTRFISLQSVGDRNRAAVARALRSASVPNPEERVGMLSRGLDVLRHSDVRGVLARVSQPTLILHGQNDALVPVAAAQYLARTLSHGSLAVIPQTGHAPFLSAPEKVGSLVREYLDG
jgi:pimeloyl-[acyl-carrier protein] methyl ester esterase